MSSAFRELAGLIRKAGDGFKANAFFKVATILDEYPDAITSAKQVKDVKGVGKSSLAKIDEFLTTGKLAAIEELKGGGPAPPPQTKDEQVGMAFL